MVDPNKSTASNPPRVQSLKHGDSFIPIKIKMELGSISKEKSSKNPGYQTQTDQYLKYTVEKNKLNR